MTVENQTAKVIGLGNDVGTVFSFSPIVIFQASDLEVRHVSSAGVETVLTEGTGSSNYSVDVTEYPGTGDVIYPADQVTPLPTGEKLVIKRILTIEQTLDLENQGGYFPDLQENAFDKLTMMVLDLQEQLDRSVKVTLSSDTDPDQLVEDLIAAAADAEAAATAAQTAETNAEAAQAAAEDAAATINLPDIQAGDAGKILEVNLTEDGYQLVDQTPITTQGDLIVGDASGDESRLAIGSTDTVLTSNGTTAAWSEVPLPEGYLKGLTLSNNSVDGDHDIDIAVGKARADDDSANLVLSTALTKQIDAAWAVGTDAGGLDTGTVASDTWYHIWLIRRSDTGVVDALFSTSATSPTMPTNYDQKRRLGSVKTDGSANIIGFVQDGDTFYFADTSSLTNDDSRLTTRAKSAFTVNTPLGVRVNGIFDILVAGASGDFSCTQTLYDGVNTGVSKRHSVYVSANTKSMTYTVQQYTDTSSQIQWEVSGNPHASIANTIKTLGWQDPRGRE